MKKEDLIKTNGQLEKQYKVLLLKDNLLRERFAIVLGCEHTEFQWGSPKREIQDSSWEEIFFKIGELNSDANYTILLQEKLRLETALQQIKEDNEQTKGN